MIYEIRNPSNILQVSIFEPLFVMYTKSIRFFGLERDSHIFGTTSAARVALEIITVRLQKRSLYVLKVQ